MMASQLLQTEKRQTLDSTDISIAQYGARSKLHLKDRSIEIYSKHKRPLGTEANKNKDLESPHLF